MKVLYSLSGPNRDDQIEHYLRVERDRYIKGSVELDEYEADVMEILNGCVPAATTHWIIKRIT